MPFNQDTVQQIASQRFANEQAQRKAEAEKNARDAAAAAAALAEAERLARIRSDQEREEIRMRAERALAEERVRLEVAALETAVEAELERLRNRSELEVLRDELADLKKMMTCLSSPKTTPSVTITTSPKTYCLSIVANNANLGTDPHYGVGKVLRVSYKLGDASPIQTTEVEEHQTLTLKGQNLRIINASWETNMKRSTHAHYSADVLHWVIGYMNEVA